MKAYNLYVNKKLYCVTRTKKELYQIINTLKAESDGLDIFKIERCVFVGSYLPFFM